MTNIAVFSKDDFRAVIREEIAFALEKKGTESEQKNTMNLNEAIKYINENGYPISKSTLYKKTSEHSIPFKRFGGKKIVFDKLDLDEWINKQLSKNDNSGVSDAIRKTALNRA
ncbi:MAG: helix-turn-helix domain-containing protein [Dysgonamonadaceae bacterium]|nr:helix-turn-helix domain-containing protein [Dysgonamonadaceae bacterium]